MMNTILESETLRPPKLLLEKCFGKKWQWRPEVSAYLRALERDLVSGIARHVALIVDYHEVSALYERAISDLKESEERATKLQASLDVIARVAMRVELDEEILITKGHRRPLGHDVRTNADPDSDVNAERGLGCDAGARPANRD